jgi:hypothetical protein
MSDRSNRVLTEAMVSAIVSPENWMTIVPDSVPAVTCRI